MGLFGLATKAEVQRTVANEVAKLGLYNEKLFGWMNNGLPVLWNDNPQNYVQLGYQGNGDVYSCVDLILTKLAYCPLLLYSVKDDKQQAAQKYKSLASTNYAKAELHRVQTKAMTEVYVQQLHDLVAKPNKYQTTTEWLKQLAGFYLLTGNAYNYYNGLPGSKKWTEMYVLPSNLIHIVSGGDLMPVKGYNIISSINWQTGVVDFNADQVSHLKTFNPNFTTYGSQLYGQSPLMAYIGTLVRNKDSRIEQNKQIKNGGLFGILAPDTSNGAPVISDPKVKADLKKQLETAKDSTDIVSRLFISGAPAKWIPMGLPSTDLQLLESIGLDRIDICNAYHIHPSLLGNVAAATDNNMEWAAKQLVYNCVMTLGDAITDKLTRDTCPAYEKAGEKLMWMFDYSVLPEIQDDMGKVDFLTMNEKREFMQWGKSTEQNADKLLVSKSMSLLEDIDMTTATFTNATQS